jgi:hypothetical protein
MAYDLFVFILFSHSFVHRFGVVFEISNFSVGGGFDFGCYVCSLFVALGFLTWIWFSRSRFGDSCCSVDLSQICFFWWFRRPYVLGLGWRIALVVSTTPVDSDSLSQKWLLSLLSLWKRVVGFWLRFRVGGRTQRLLLTAVDFLDLRRRT